jgi:hypothetical protein
MTVALHEDLCVCLRAFPPYRSAVTLSHARNKRCDFVVFKLHWMSCFPFLLMQTCIRILPMASGSTLVTQTVFNCQLELYQYFASCGENIFACCVREVERNTWNIHISQYFNWNCRTLAVTYSKSTGYSRLKALLCSSLRNHSCNIINESFIC